MSAARARRLVATAALTAGALIAAGLATADAQAAATRVPISGTGPSWAVPSRQIAAPADTGTGNARVYLPGRAAPGRAGGLRAERRHSAPPRLWQVPDGRTGTAPFRADSRPVSGRPAMADERRAQDHCRQPALRRGLRDAN